AAPAQRMQILAQLRDAKGAAATQALARAIPKLPEAERAKVREALVKRLARITVEAIREKLHDSDGEMRRAAAAACMQRNDSTLVADLISLLNDTEPAVSAEALASLEEITSQNLGDSPADWAEWLKAGNPK